MMQAKLIVNEFAYLLHALHAQKIIGVNNTQLFPDEEDARDILLRGGLQSLKEHGWLQPSEADMFKTHTGLVLLTAVIASPEHTIMLTRAMPNDGRQTITYYFAQGMIVEQFYTADEQYLLTKIDALADVVSRLQQALNIPSTLQAWEIAITLNANIFEQTVKQAQTGNLLGLLAALRETSIASGDLEQLAKIIGSLQPVGNLEIAALSGEQLNDWQSLIILRGEDNSVWSMSNDDAAESVHLYPLDLERFTSTISATIPPRSLVANFTTANNIQDS